MQVLLLSLLLSTDRRAFHLEPDAWYTLIASRGQALIDEREMDEDEKQASALSRGKR
jgi:hypothetical protein